MKFPEKMTNSINAVLRLVFPILSTLWMIMTLCLTSVFTYFRYASIAPLVQVLFLMIGFQFLGKLCVEKDEYIFNRDEFRFMLIAATITTLLVYFDIKVFYKSDGGIMGQLAASTVAVVIGMLVSPEELYFGNNVVKIVIDICNSVKNGTKSRSVCIGTLIAAIGTLVFAHYNTRHNEEELAVSNTRTIFVYIFILVASVLAILYLKVKNRKNKPSN